MEIRREGLERAHGGRGPVGGNGDIMRVGAAIDARDIRVDALQEGGASRCLRPGGTSVVSHGTLRHAESGRSIREQGCGGTVFS
jgi:hypothetical protein